MPVLLAFIAHPDDESYAFGGTIALAAKAGWRCLVHCASFGEGGERHDGGDPDPGMLALARARELEASCDRLGAQAPVFWGWPDGGLSQRNDGPRRIRSAIRRVRPDLVLAPGPDGAYGHPDHLAVHRWVQEAAESLEDAPPVLSAAFPRGLFIPQYEKCVAAGIMGDPPLLERGDIGIDSPDYRLDISAVREQKIASIGSHLTQLPGGDPEAMFPPGIVEATLGEEWYCDAWDGRGEDVRAMLADLAGG